MSHASTGTRVAGSSLAVAAALLAGVLLFHGPLAADPGAQMRAIAEGAGRWAAVHWVAAIALSLFAVAGLAALGAGSRLTQSPGAMFAWAVLTVGALGTVATAVIEVTVVAGAAVAGETGTFGAWWAFAEGMANGFAFLALAVAVIAGREARSPGPATPAWAAWIGAIAGVVSFLGWALGSWFDVAGASLVWLLASLVMCLWLLWFGLALARTPAG